MTYAPLLKALQSVDEYEPIRVLDSHMGITMLTRFANNIRRGLYKSMSFGEFSVHVYFYMQGGPYPTTAYIWRISEPLDGARHTAAIALASRNAPSCASRAMSREFFERFSVLGNQEAAMRAMYRFLSPHDLRAQNVAQRIVDDRCLQYLSQSEDTDPMLFFDLRHLNGPKGDSFTPFWDTLGEFLQLEVGESAHERRHSVDAIAYASRIVSIPSVIREVTTLLHAKPGHDKDPIPGKDCVRLQFSPNHPAHLTAGRFSGRCDQ